MCLTFLPEICKRCKQQLSENVGSACKLANTAPLDSEPDNSRNDESSSDELQLKVCFIMAVWMWSQIFFSVGHLKKKTIGLYA